MPDEGLSCMVAQAAWREVVVTLHFPAVVVHLLVLRSFFASYST